MTAQQRDASPPYRVLVFPGGTEIGLEIQRALGHLKEVELLGAGSSLDVHGPLAYRNWNEIPNVGDPGWFEALTGLIEREQVDFVYPAHDIVVTELADHLDSVGAIVVSQPPEACRLTRSKRDTYTALDGAVPVPAIYDDPSEIDAYPVFVKPDRSQGSQGASIVNSADELRHWTARGSDLVMEHLPGDEYTIDCFSDRERGVLFARGRTRVRTRAGISVWSRAGGDQELFADYARRIAERVALQGAWFFQLRGSRDGTPTLLEVGPRIAGTMALNRVLGVNFPMLSIYEALRVPVAISPVEADAVIDRPLANRFTHDLSYSTVYVDLDDTLIVRDAVNVPLAAFLFQCLNEGRRLVLLTRHVKDVPTTLAQFRLSSFFDEVIRVDDGVPKSTHISEPDAILIDDSFRERNDASENLGIATFDSSMIELLVDHRL